MSIKTGLLKCAAGLMLLGGCTSTPKQKGPVVDTTGLRTEFVRDRMLSSDLTSAYKITWKRKAKPPSDSGAVISLYYANKDTIDASTPIRGHYTRIFDQGMTVVSYDQDGYHPTKAPFHYGREERFQRDSNGVYKPRFVWYETDRYKARTNLTEKAFRP